MLPNSLYVMDTNFWTSLGNYSLDARCEMACELGYTGVYESLSSGFPHSSLKSLNEIPPRHAIPLAGIYYTADLHHLDRSVDEVSRVIEEVKTADTIELSVHASEGIPARPEPELEKRLHRFLDRLLPLAQRSGKTLSLYPHIWFYVERIEQAVRVAREYGQPNLRVTFCGFHWYAVDGTGLAEKLTQAAPLLHRVNVCGTRRLPQGTPGLPATIECLSQGEFDHFALLCLLNRISYSGPIGLQGYSAGGDVYMRLQTSLAAYKSMRDRAIRHATWAAHAL